MKFSVLYKHQRPGFWKYYIFIDDTSMIVFNIDFSESEYRDDLNMDWLDVKDFKEVDNSELSQSSRRTIIRSVYGVRYHHR